MQKKLKELQEMKFPEKWKLLKKMHPSPTIFFRQIRTLQGLDHNNS